MKQRVERWLDETHSGGFELLRLFVARFFENDMVSIPGEWQKVAIGLFATLASAGILVFNVYWARYGFLHSPGSTAVLYRAAVREDLLSLLTVLMAITAVLTIVQWQALFPSRREYLALAGLPVAPREIFLAKFAALLLVFGAFVAAGATLPSLLAGSLISGRWEENPSLVVNTLATFAVLAGACVSVFFGLLAIQGLLLLVLPARRFEGVSLAVQASLFIITVAAIPLMGRQPAEAAWWPPVWFLRLWEAIVTGQGSGAGPALGAMTLPVSVSLTAYWVSYHRYRRGQLEARVGPAAARRGAGPGSWLLDHWIRQPAEQAAFAFIWKTLARSRAHRLILLAYAGLALGWITNGLLDAPPVSLRDEGLYGLVVVLAPIGISILITAGLRYLFSLPVEPRAAWVFQSLETEGRGPWLAAVERFVVWCGIVPVFAAGLPVAIAVLGPVRAFTATTLALLAGLLCFERLFRNWRKLPFTCTYLPGKTTVWMQVFRCTVGASFLVPVAQLFLWASAEAAAFLAVFSLLLAVRWRWRRLRQREWADCNLLWDEQPDAAVMALGLQPEDEESRAAASAPLAKAPAPDFAATLIASRGLLPAAWSDEIQEDRRRPWALWEDFIDDLRYATRLIRKHPLLSAMVVLTLTIGIGVNASVFTVVEGVAIRAHIYKDPATFVRIVPMAVLQARSRFVSYQEYVSLRDGNRSVRELAAYRLFPALLGDDDPSGVPGLAVSCNFFVVEGLDRPLLGRLLDAGDCGAPGQAPVAVISESTWRNRFHGDPGIVGQVARINNRSVPVVGVVSDRSSLWVQPVGVWVPYTAQPYFDAERNFFHENFLWLSLAGRLAPGQTRAAARAEFNLLERQMDQLEAGRRTAVETTDGSWIEEFQLLAPARDLVLLGFFVGAFHLVLVIACANVATLLLSRAAGRVREIAVRLSLGAPRVRLVRMLVTESLLLASLAGAASVWIAHYLPRPLFRFISPRSPEIPLPPDWRVFAYVAVVVVVTGVAAGLAPALASVKVDLTATLKGGGRTMSGSGGTRLRGMLVAAQVSLSMVLLVEAALFARSENQTLHADPGYQPRQVVVAPLRFPDNTQREAARVRLDRITARLRVLPGVRAVTVTDDLPMLEHVTVNVRPPARADAILPLDVYAAAPGFFEAMGTPIVAGRGFIESDGPALVVSQSLARTLWRRENPIGKTLPFPEGSLPVVGVARDVAPMRFGGSDNPPVYRNGVAHPNRTFLAVRFASESLAAAPAVRAAIREVDPNLVVVARRLQTWIDLVTEQLWNVVTLIVVLGMVATVLATAGIYGTVSFAVSQRMRELGIRVALGAGSAHIVREVFAIGGKPVLQGLLLGLWMSVAMAASLRQTLGGTPLRVDSSDPLVYGAALLLLAGAAAAAMIGPARRGLKSDPLHALRCD